MRLRLFAAAAALAISAANIPGVAEAAYIVTFSEVGSNVIASGTGTVDTSGLTRSSTTQYAAAFVDPMGASELTGSGALGDRYSGTISGPLNFGSGSFALSTPPTRTGDPVGLYINSNAALDFIVVPDSYLSGAPLADTATYAGQTFASLGLTPGSYVYSFGSGANADAITVDIGASVSVPEPATFALLCTGLAGLFGLGLIRRQ